MVRDNLWMLAFITGKYLGVGINHKGKQFKLFLLFFPYLIAEFRSFLDDENICSLRDRVNK